MCPFKESLKLRVEQARAQTIAYQEAQKERRKAAFQAARQAGSGTVEGASSSSSSSIEQLAQRAAEEERDYQLRHPDGIERDEYGKPITPFVDSSRRAYFREFKKVVEESDVILEVLDSRDPLGYRCADIERLIMRKDPNKKIILVLNKVDLIPKKNMIAWLKYLRHQLPTIAFKCSTQSQRSHLAQSSVPVTAAGAELLGGSECLGGDTLLKLLKNYCRSADLKTSITVGIIGYPNTGKSSLINSLKRTRSVGVGATPGFTKKTQLIHLDKNIRLLDCPGIVFSSKDASAADIALRNCIKVEQIEDPIPPVELLMKRCPHEQLLVLYRIPEFSDVREFLAHIATKRGMFKKGGGQPNITAAARVVLQDWNSGRIQYYTEPPEVDQTPYLSAEIVSTWGRDFFDQDLFHEGDSALLESLPAAAASKVPRMQLAPSQAQTDGELVSLLDDANAEFDPSAERGKLVIQTKSLKSNKSSKAASSSAVVESSDEEDELNPKINQSLKQQAKADQRRQRKERARQARLTTDDASSNDDFNFNTDFVADYEDDDDDESGDEEDYESGDEEDDQEDEDAENEGNTDESDISDSDLFGR